MARGSRNSSIKNSSEFRPANRRELLKGLSLAGLAAGSATTLAVLPVEAEPKQDDPRYIKYQETNHIRTFYDLSRR
jgi:hypothetical protein